MLCAHMLCLLSSFTLLSHLDLPKAGREAGVTEPLLPFPYKFLASQGSLSLSDLQKVFLSSAAVLLSVKCPRSDCSVTRSRKNTFLQEEVLPILKCLQHLSEPHSSVHRTTKDQELCKAGEDLLLPFSAVLLFQSLNFQAVVVTLVSLPM